MAFLTNSSEDVVYACVLRPSERSDICHHGARRRARSRVSDLLCLRQAEADASLQGHGG
mgnify:CR=1 FL=1